VSHQALSVTWPVCCMTGGLVEGRRVPAYVGERPVEGESKVSVGSSEDSEDSEDGGVTGFEAEESESEDGYEMKE